MIKCQKELVLINQHYFFLFLGSLLIIFMTMVFFRNNNYETHKHIAIKKAYEKAFKVSLVKKSLVKSKIKIAKKIKNVSNRKVEKIKKISNMKVKKVKKKIMPIIKKREETLAETEKTAIKKNRNTSKKEMKYIHKSIVKKTSINLEKKEHFLSELREIIAKNKSYPRIAKRMKKEGTSIIAFLLKKSGNIENVVLEKSCGHRIIDKAALHLVRSIVSYKPIPDDVSLEDLEMIVPIAYNIK